LGVVIVLRHNDGGPQEIIEYHVILQLSFSLFCYFPVLLSINNGLGPKKVRRVLLEFLLNPI